MEITVHVKTGKKESGIVKNKEGDYTIYLKSHPVKGQANKELIGLMATYFKIKSYRISIIKGLKSPFKTIKIAK